LVCSCRLCDLFVRSARIVLVSFSRVLPSCRSFVAFTGVGVGGCGALAHTQAVKRQPSGWSQPASSDALQLCRLAAVAKPHFDHVVQAAVAKLPLLDVCVAFVRCCCCVCVSVRARVVVCGGVSAYVVLVCLSVCLYLWCVCVRR
jgi:hypothetical protein